MTTSLLRHIFNRPRPPEPPEPPFIHADEATPGMHVYCSHGTGFCHAEVLAVGGLMTQSNWHPTLLITCRFYSSDGTIQGYWSLDRDMWDAYCFNTRQDGHTYAHATRGALHAD